MRAQEETCIILLQLEELKQQQATLNKEKVDLENQLEAEQEYIVNKLQKQLEGLGKEKIHLQQEKAELRRQVKELHGSAEQLYREKIRLEADKEVEEESIVNRLQRQIEGLIQNYKVCLSSLSQDHSINASFARGIYLLSTDTVKLRNQGVANLLGLPIKQKTLGSHDQGILHLHHTLLMQGARV